MYLFNVAINDKDIAIVFVAVLYMISVHFFIFMWGGGWPPRYLILCDFYKIGFFETTPLLLFGVVVHLTGVVSLFFALCLWD